ncbi:scyllo-inositol 2-dehydrogenase (NADP+) [Dinghuibacter silviterrae]|uniref:Scyllo-inositol 2-dehydrogenase (NADP+) n=2 Tax=Dinghuibacter silviterrae TaxID=1539049 RepID=A0A4R8DTR4_9BACT|nr:scyllo-inositol 2-dehydrogenase (NADP+) [Dinghuibacter silviterrae]
MSSPLQVGFVGFGMSARTFHAPFLALIPGYRLHTAWERHGPQAPALYPGIRSVQDPRDLFDNPEIDLIVVTTPNTTHAEYAAWALRSGKHVVLEKPFTISTGDAVVLEDLAQAQGKVLAVFHNRRYVSDFLTVRQVLAGQPLGPVHEYEAHYDRYRPEAKPNAWREEPLEGSGILYDLGPHLIDQAFCLFGLPQSLYADVRLQRAHARAVDYFDLQLYYPGLKVILKGGMLVREPGPKYMIHGLDGSFIKYGDDPQEPILRAGGKPLGPGWGEEDPAHYGLLHTKKAGEVIYESVPSLPGNYGLFYQDLYATLREGAPLKTTPAHGYNTVRLIELALESSSRQAVVDATGLREVAYP